MNVKNKFRYFSVAVTVSAGIMLMASCSDDILEPSVDPVKLSADVEEIRLPVRAAYHAVKVSSSEGLPSGIKVLADRPWIELVADTVASDGYVEIHVERNEELGGRTGKLTIGDADNGGITVSVYQCGLSDDDNNSGLNCYAGCGYNIFQELNSESSICSPVVDYDAATAIDPMIVQTVGRNIQDVKTITSNSLVEMSSLMTHSVEKKSSGLLGGKKTISRFEEQESKTRKEQTGYAYINLQRIAACTSMDLSKVQQYVEQGQTQILSKEFRRQYEEILRNPTQENIFRLFRDFGTHIVSYADLGGSMDIAVCFNRTMVGELNMRADDFRRYFFNSEPSDFTLDGRIQGLTTSVSDKGTFKVAGGTEATRRAIISDCESQGHISSDNIYAWTRSLPGSNFMSAEALRLLAPVNVQLVPIWSIFPQNLANIFFECAIVESQKSYNTIDDAKAGIDNYGISIRSADFMKFADRADESLVRVVYANQTDIRKAGPILEICNEYVPELKVNERVSVIYPIRNGRAFHGTGLYPGDGKVCGPAWLTFSEGDIYVLPVEGTNCYDRIDSIYYLHGNIYLTSLGLNLQRSIAMEWEPKGILDLPIVKIGSGYWTRRNIGKSIASGVNVGGYFRNGELTVRTGKPDQEVWVNVRSEINSAKAPEKVGNSIDSIYNEPVLWYFPTDKDRNNLQEYIGYDPRHLLKGQLTGFDAQFEGFYGPGGIDGIKEIGREEQPSFFNTDKCYLISKTDRTSLTGSAICLDKNYNWRTVALGTGNGNFFPLRLFRSSYYKYDNYNKSTDNYPKK